MGCCHAQGSQGCDVGSESSGSRDDPGHGLTASLQQWRIQVALVLTPSLLLLLLQHWQKRDTTGPVLHPHLDLITGRSWSGFLLTQMKGRFTGAMCDVRCPFREEHLAVCRKFFLYIWDLGQDVPSRPVPPFPWRAIGGLSQQLLKVQT